MPKTKKQSSAKKACKSCNAFACSMISRFIVLVSIALFLFAMTIVQFQATSLVQSTHFNPIEIIYVEPVEEEEEDFYNSAPTNSEGLVVSFFDAYNAQDFVTACNIISDDKCDASNTADVDRFSEEHDKLANGYNDVVIWSPEVEDFHSDVVCAEYNYQYAFDSNEKRIQETLSFYVNKDSITARVCEQKLLDGEKGSCPILSKRDFCLE